VLNKAHPAMTLVPLLIVSLFTFVPGRIMHAVASGS